MAEKVSTKNKKVQKKKNTILNLLIAICAVIFLFSGYKLVSYYFEYKKMDEVYTSINDLIIGDFIYEPDSEGLLKEAPEINMAELQAINSEIVGYILIPGTKVSYPVAHSEDPYKYLNYDIRNNPSRAGAIFIASNNATDFSDDNTIIYGHNMLDSSMFSQLGLYVDEEDYIKKHAYIYIYTPSEIRLYRVFSAQVSEETSEIYTLNFSSHDDLVSFVHRQAENTAQPTKKVPEDVDSIITLSTCRNSSGPERNVILAYLVDIKTTN